MDGDIHSEAQGGLVMRTELELKAELKRLESVLAGLHISDVKWDVINSRIWALKWVLEMEED